MAKSTQIKYTAPIRRGFGYIIGRTEGPAAVALAERALDWLKQEYLTQEARDSKKGAPPDEEGESCPDTPSTPTPEGSPQTPEHDPATSPPPTSPSSGSMPSIL